MGYAKINNLYKNPAFLDIFKKVWVLEKVHGTSAHINIETLYNEHGCYHNVNFYSGGADHSSFCRLFEVEKLLEIYKESTLFEKDMTLYGEAYGGKLHGMSHSYGKELCFIVFDVKVGDKWLDVPDAAKVAERFGQEFVWYKLVDNTIEELNKYRDQPSELAKLRGCGDDKPAEGIVVKPLIEIYDKNGGRLYYKHKRAEFCETASKRETFVEHGRAVILTEAQAVADEWITPMRLSHVLDKLSPKATGIQDTGRIIKAMQDDIRIEGQGEIDWSIEKDIMAKIAANTAKLYKEALNAALEHITNC